MRQIEQLYYKIGVIVMSENFNPETYFRYIDQIAALKAQRTKERRNLAALRRYNNIFHSGLQKQFYRDGDHIFCDDTRDEEMAVSYTLSELKQAIRQGEIK